MKKICRSVSELKDRMVFERLENKYGLDFGKELKEFFEVNNGGIPANKSLVIHNVEYELRCFLSFNEEEYNSIFMPLDFFQKNTQGKIIPFGKDSGDNYFCRNIENKCIYYWDKEENLYYKLSDDFSEFIRLIDGDADN